MRWLNLYSPLYLCRKSWLCRQSSCCLIRLHYHIYLSCILILQHSILVSPASSKSTAQPAKSLRSLDVQQLPPITGMIATIRPTSVSIWRSFFQKQPSLHASTTRATCCATTSAILPCLKSV